MRRSGDLVWMAAAASLAILAAAPAAAAQQPAGPVGLSATSHGPIDIEADTGTYDNSTCESTFSGAVEVLQGNARLRAHLIHAFMSHKPGTSADQAACGEVQRLEADGDVFYVTPDQRARGDHAVYNADENLIVMTGDVILVQGQNVVHGDKLTIHTQTRAAQMESNAQGRGTPGRVRGVFYQSPAAGAPMAPQ